MIDGLITAPCGTNFDQALDDAIGYLDFNESDFASSLGNFAPGLNDDNYLDYDADGSNDSTGPIRRIRRRWWFSAIIKKIGAVS